MGSIELMPCGMSISFDKSFRDEGRHQDGASAPTQPNTPPVPTRRMNRYITKGNYNAITRQGCIGDGGSVRVGGSMREVVDIGRRKSGYC